ncbi:hypothetical protein PVK06_032417 [Gossypium arboreum]|uniref:F-box associated beta-propeller type 3 domain-containing protein n=1 Tax=Gossypium arboreum TaxID=29729 RepID=A0ABR0NTZ7_GOSAR|nr:hypothetical protein PVK06_032417 [Gossypium arboreum]
MENQNQESTPTQPNQRLGSPSQELHSTSYNEQSQKRNSPESPQHESHVSAQSPKRSRNGSLPRPSFPQEIIFEILSNLPVKSLLRFSPFIKPDFKGFQKDFPFEVFSNEAGKHVDGTLNWAVFSGQDGDFSIVSLDLAWETYKEVTQPCYGDGVDERTLGVLDGCLCVLCSYRKLYADVWVMKEYGKRESWTKLVSIPYLPYERSEMFLTPVSVSKSGEILLRYGVNILLYNPKKNMFRIPMFPYDVISYIRQAEVYEESLVSLTAANQHR